MLTGGTESGKRARLQAPQVGKGIIETIDVVDAKPSYFLCLEETKYKIVHGIEHLSRFDANPHQIANIEKAPVIDPLRRRLPKCQLIGLLGQQCVESIKA